MTVLLATIPLIFSLGGNAEPRLDASTSDEVIREAIKRRMQAIGYEVISKKRGSDEQVFSLEDRDSASYNPSGRMCMRLKSIRPWSRSFSTYFRYWLCREVFASAEQAERRDREYTKDYEQRLATAGMSSHMVSKTVLRVGARRRGRVVYLLVTDGAYTLFDDKGQRKILEAMVKAKGT